MLLLLLLLGYGAAEKSILIIGGIGSNGTVEKFSPRTNTSTIIHRHAQLTAANGSDALRVTPVNDTHALLFSFRVAPFGMDFDTIYYIDSRGKLSDGPTAPNTTAARAFAFHLTSLPPCSPNGQRRPIYCAVQQDDALGRRQITEIKECEELSGDRSQFVHHSIPGAGNFMTADSIEKHHRFFYFGTRIQTLSSFGEDLIAIGSSFTERYTESNWNTISRRPGTWVHSKAVKLNESALLVCGNEINMRNGYMNKTKCDVYILETDKWIDGPVMKGNMICGSELVLVGQSVYAFGGSKEYADWHVAHMHSGGQGARARGRNSQGSLSTIQTLDISNGIENAQWKLEKTALKANHTGFGVWVIDEPEFVRIEFVPRPKKSYTYAVVYVVGMFLIAAAAIIIFVRM